MKIRNGFVSNSSSSSFIISLEENPSDHKEVQKLVFGDLEGVFPFDKYLKTEDISKIIYDEICKSSRATFGEIFDLYYDNMFFKSKYLNSQIPEILDQTFKTVKEFYLKNINNFLYILEFSDGDGVLDTAIEHGGYLEKIGAVRFSHH
jgi:hypothetical protein